VDTACSSSLVALHLAVQALRRGECSLALAGGVMVMATPVSFMGFSQQQGLAADGRCKAFSASADGTGWGEGAGLVLLERLSDAQRNGHPVLAVIRGSAVNQDGASNGLTAPNGPSQQRVIAQALANAGLTFDDVDVVEGHGTGTALGDPIEAQALLATYGRERPEGRPLYLGSIKSNLGHTTAAAGIAGVMKMVLALQAGVLPKTLHAEEPSPKIDWDDRKLRLLTESEPWPVREHPRRAAVSSFGISGTNAHLILEQAPEAEPAAEPDAPLADDGAWLLSARSAGALREQARRLERSLSANAGLAARPRAVGAALRRRAALSHRAVVLGEDSERLADGLRALAEGTNAANLVQGVVRPGSTDLVFVYPGQGGQWAGMGADLLDANLVFAQAIAECDAALYPYTDWHLLDVLRQTPDEPTLTFDRVDVVQPALWALMIALTKLWQSYGVHPAAVIGHSQGEIAAAHVAGALSLQDSARIVALRSKALIDLSGGGGMASLAVSAERGRLLLANYPEVSIAAVNSPSSIVVSGDPAQLRTLLEAAEAQGIRKRLLPVDYASHSAHVERLRDGLLTDLAGIAAVADGPTIPFYSALTGGVLDPATLGTAEYWYENLRRPVRFHEATSALIADGFRAFLEPTAHPTLTPAIQETGDHADTALATVTSLQRDQSGPRQIALNLARAWTQGQPTYPAVESAGALDLPTYAFQHKRFWLERAAAETATTVEASDAEFWDAVRDGSDTLATALGLDDDPTREALRSVLPALEAWRLGREQASALQSWRYQITWEPTRQTDKPTLSGTWVVAVAAATADSAWTEVCRQAIADHGGRAALLVVEVGDTRDVVAERLRDLGGDEPAGVVSLLGFDEEPSAEFDAVTRGLTSSIALVGGVTDLGGAVPIWFLTTDAVGARPDDRVEHPTQAQIWGFGKTLAVENPKLWGGQLDLPAEPAAGVGELLATALAKAGGEDQLALRGGALSARRLVRDSAPKSEAGTWQPHGTVLVTGATGALGTHLVRWLARRGADHLVLLNNTGPDAAKSVALREELAERYPNLGLVIEACDLSDADALRRILLDIPAAHPLTAVFHAAGVADGGLLDELTLPQFDNVLRAKAVGARNLHELTKDLNLEAFVMYSSCAGVLPAITEANYAAANAYLDGLAAHRRANGLAATAVVWGVWGGGGIGGASLAEWLREGGVRAMEPKVALAALGDVLDRDETHVAVVDIDWARFTAFSQPNVPTIVARIPEVKAALRGAGREAEDEAAEIPPLRAKLAGLAASRWHRALLDTICAEAAAVLGHGDATGIDPERLFRDSGFDSLTGVELRNRINVLTGLKVPSTLVFDHPTPVALARHLRASLEAESGGRPQDAQQAPVPLPVVVVTDVDVDDASDEDLFALIDGSAP
ncbi:MAG TPA: SDR family NAD(P)-dependent oxidoreductase, partial [Actinospica sp.]|nr:SDR family NAD(P)-dependent oxidoreductase [Actinospica sp.]